MKLQRQTLFGGKEGNCFAACVASLLGLDLSDVPNFCARQTWWVDLIDWVRPFGLRPLSFPTRGRTDEWATWFAPDQVVIASGPAVRGFDHSTLYLDGKLFWDPHPSGDGILLVNDVIFFMAVEPHRVVAR